MQEAFGGSFLLKLFIIFFIIYVCFIGVALNFAKTYRIKNHVINYLEQNQYVIGDDLSGLTSYLDNVPYKPPADRAQKDCDEYKKNGKNTEVVQGVCIVQEGDDSTPYYRVFVYFGAEFPFFGINITVPVTGETKVVKIVS